MSKMVACGSVMKGHAAIRPQVSAQSSCSLGKELFLMTVLAVLKQEKERIWTEYLPACVTEHNWHDVLNARKDKSSSKFTVVGYEEVNICHVDYSVITGWTRKEGGLVWWREGWCDGELILIRGEVKSCSLFDSLSLVTSKTRLVVRGQVWLLLT